MQASELSADNETNGSSRLLSGGSVHDFQKGFHIVICLTTEQFSTLPQSILNELWASEDVGISGSCRHIASSLHHSSLTYICGYHSELCSQTMFSGSVPEPMQ